MADTFPARPSIRLDGYDYSQPAAYFLTLCVLDRVCLFGEVGNDSTVSLTPAGLIVQAEWQRTPQVRPSVELDAFVVMPNHLHAIVLFLPTDGNHVGAHSSAPASRSDALHAFGRSTHSLGSLVAGFKGITSKRINTLHGTPGAKVWQRNYYERVIRNEAELTRARDYVEGNPGRWAEDRENPEAVLKR